MRRFAFRWYDDDVSRIFATPRHSWPAATTSIERHSRGKKMSTTNGSWPRPDHALTNCASPLLRNARNDSAGSAALSEARSSLEPAAIVYVGTGRSG